MEDREHVTMRERVLLEDNDPELAAKNAAKRNDFSAHLDAAKRMLKSGEELHTHYVMKHHPELGYVLIGDNNGVPTAFACRRLAEEAITANKKDDCKYHVLALVNVI